MCKVPSSSGHWLKKESGQWALHEPAPQGVNLPLAGQALLHLLIKTVYRFSSKGVASLTWWCHFYMKLSFWGHSLQESSLIPPAGEKGGSSNLTCWGDASLNWIKNSLCIVEELLTNPICYLLTLLQSGHSGVGYLWRAETELLIRSLARSMSLAGSPQSESHFWHALICYA